MGLSRRNPTPDRGAVSQGGPIFFHCFRAGDVESAMKPRPGTTILPARTEPLLSLCMIVKNERANLGRCLDSVRNLVNEMVVVDTGSTDGTQDMARQRGEFRPLGRILST